ncbi:NAD-dependent epimerase/dehydratase family protein [Chelativorans salis]|uniref:GDP-mannose 4,6-dehydratase n=1 Tax=Chelativorans salis TaxID=2978478 RepID=A0ABT2LKY8_9HYPH|nr:NAD-dependent epimerase/dehydratase family protein [Chelativorans sp. EGI FJ00035]MCT7374058.1 GDP-mannose 4,6-dehydratase [Chelativorans sp. EGI FJ00035]
MRKPTQNDRCLVAGGAGFIGSNLCRHLLKDGISVDVVDDLSTGRMENIAELRQNPSFRFIKGDVADENICQRLPHRRYSQVYHLACPTGVPNIELLGEKMLLASSAGTLNLLKVAQRSRAKFLFASTAEAYGDPQVFPQPETYAGNVDPIGPRSPYEEGKRFGEALTRYFGQKHGIDTYIVRIFNTYGPGMSPTDQRVIPQMLARLIQKKPVVIYGDGSQTRTFLYVDDLLAGFRLVIERGEPGAAYNIGGSDPVTIRDLLETVKKASGLTGRGVHKQHFIEDHRGRWPDTAKVRALGWRPKVSLEQGIRRIHQDFCEEVGLHTSTSRSKTEAPFMSTSELPRATFSAQERRSLYDQFHRV